MNNKTIIVLLFIQNNSLLLLLIPSIKPKSIIIIEFGFCIIWRIMEILDGVIRRDGDTLLDLHNSS